MKINISEPIYAQSYYYISSIYMQLKIGLESNVNNDRNNYLDGKFSNSVYIISGYQRFIQIMQDGIVYIFTAHM